MGYTQSKAFARLIKIVWANCFVLITLNKVSVENVTACSVDLPFWNSNWHRDINSKSVTKLVYNLLYSAYAFFKYLIK